MNYGMKYKNLLPYLQNSESHTKKMICASCENEGHSRTECLEYCMICECDTHETSDYWVGKRKAPPNRSVKAIVVEEQRRPARTKYSIRIVVHLTSCYL